MTENLRDMSLTVCVCVSDCMSFTRGALSKCSHLTGIKWTEASADDQGMLDIIAIHKIMLLFNNSNKGFSILKI